MEKKKPACGLCGRTSNLTKTDCCDNWICDDEHKYVPFSYEATSCSRNHRRYTLCSFHYNERHDGKWQDCEKCKEEFDLEDYVDMGTNEFNFEKLSNPPKISIKCVNCGFKSNSMNDFAYKTSKGMYCIKHKCQKKAMTF
jgi:hypothetical protein